MHEGVAGLLRDKTRPSRIPPLEPEVTARVVELTQADPPGAEQRLHGSSQGNDLKTTGPEVGYLVIFAACYFDFAAGYFVRWPASNSAPAMTNCRGD